MNKRKTIRKVGVEPYQSHRNDFRTCPHCDHCMDHKEWDKAAHTLVLEPRCYKSGNIVLITECPKCFEDSWVHKPMSCFEYTDAPEKWKEAVVKKEAAVKLQALRDWANGLCGKCAKLESGEVNYHAWRDCCDGCRSGPVKTECEEFVELNKG